MAHYAQVNSDKIVVQVLVMDNDMETNDGEQACIDWLQANVHKDDWVKTSYNNKIRKQYAGIGFTYDSTKDKFIAMMIGNHLLHTQTMTKSISGMRMYIRPTILKAGLK